MEQRTFPRIKKRLMVEYALEGRLCNGFTRDLSYTGFFVIASRLPSAGTVLPATLHLPDGRRLSLTGKVARSRRVPPALAHTFANGFSIELVGYSEDYTRFVNTLR